MKNLEIIISKTKEEVFFEADSRKLFRVFDNLMQNIYKYAHPGTRVYIDAEKLEDQLYVQFRNTSHEQINKTPVRISRSPETQRLFISLKYFKLSIIEDDSVYGISLHTVSLFGLRFLEYHGFRCR